MIDVQQEVKLLKEQKIQNMMVKIESDIAEGKRFSFHHYATKSGLPAQDIQNAWAKHSHGKRVAV